MSAPSRQDEVHVAELVPEVAAQERRLVRALDQRLAAECAQQVEMGGLGLVPAGEQAVDGAHAALGRDDEARPALAGGDAPIGGDHALERPDDGRAHRADAAPPRPPPPPQAPPARTRPAPSRVASTRRAVASGTRNHSGPGRSPASSEETPQCSTIGATAIPRATSAVITRSLSGRPALGISALPGSIA